MAGNVSSEPFMFDLRDCIPILDFAAHVQHVIILQVLMASMCQNNSYYFWGKYDCIIYHNYYIY